jgi:hypothetical protein
MTHQLNKIHPTWQQDPRDHYYPRWKSGVDYSHKSLTLRILTSAYRRGKFIITGKWR